MRRVSEGRVLSAECAGGTPDCFAAQHAPDGSCPQPSATEEFVDPTPELPGRPVFPGQKREPRPEDFITPDAEREGRCDTYRTGPGRKDEAQAVDRTLHLSRPGPGRVRVALVRALRAGRMCS